MTRHGRKFDVIEDITGFISDSASERLIDNDTDNDDTDNDDTDNIDTDTEWDDETAEFTEALEDLGLTAYVMEAIQSVAPLSYQVLYGASSYS
jgi:hypothetical protein